ncbi:hypothetical protein MTR72_37845 [Bradyrhizobium sp. ISRA442]|uniref:hypothetical protein n=1 Tax=Bradyrhizobium sp. ISRA442 TaxID=2866197 RepID=UPI00311B2D5D
MADHHDSAEVHTATPGGPTVAQPDDDAPDPVDPPPASKTWLESVLQWVAPISLLLNFYLAYDKLTQEKIAQPGPHIARASIDGRGGAALVELKRLADAFSTQFSKPSIAQTPGWISFIDEQKKLPPIALRNQVIRFLTVQNFTSTAYEGLTVLTSSGKIADVGLLAPNSTILVFYKDESMLADGKVSYRLAGTKDDVSLPVPPPPRDAIEIISNISKRGLQSLGSVPDASDRLNNLLEILNRGAN